jgi:hypothetical protein
MTEVNANDATSAPLWSYRPGSWYAVFGPEIAVLLPSAQKEYLAPLWSLVDGGSGFDEVLDALLASGLSRLPGFALVSSGAGPTRVLLRGVGISATATTASGEVTLDGSAGGTWVERSIDAVSKLSVLVEHSDPGAFVAGDLAVPTGLVRVSRIDRPAVAPAVVPAAAPAPVVEPVTAPVAEPVAEPVAVPVAEPVEQPVAVPIPEPADDLPTELIEAPPFDVPLEKPAPLEPSPLDGEHWTVPTFAGDPLPVTPVDAPDAVLPVPGFAPPPPPLGGGPIAPPPPLPIGNWEPVEPAPASAEPADTSGAIAKLVVSDGQSVLVNGVVLIGRAPEARRFAATEQPQLVTVPSRLHEISSTHVEVRPGSGADQGTAVVTDMGSTNGTVLVQPGLGPEDLKPGIAVALVPGAIINLGDGITIQVTRP